MSKKIITRKHERERQQKDRKAERRARRLSHDKPRPISNPDLPKQTTEERTKA